MAARVPARARLGAMTVIGHRLCRGCRTMKDPDAFYGNRRDSLCKACHSARGKAYHAANAEKIRARVRKWREDNPEWALALHREGHLRRNFGLTSDDYNAMLEEQNGVCAICQQPETAKQRLSDEPRLLAVDHDHTTGAVRGLLCSRCNRALGIYEARRAEFDAYLN